MAGSCQECCTIVKGCHCKKLLAACLVLMGGVWLGQKIRWIRSYLHFREKAKQKRQQADDSKETLRRKLETSNETELEKRETIVAMPSGELSTALKTGKFTPLEVLQAFQYKAMEATKKNNCVTEPVVEAELWAKELEEDSTKDGLLYGIPVSIKENLNIQGYDSTMGFAKFVDKPADSDCVVVQVLKSQGAIPFMKTNVPQSLLSYSCDNTVFGRTTHPMDPSRGPGGSSGGEGALLKCDGSPIGIGTDIAGSVRIPAHMSGVCALRPTEQRISHKGLRGCLPGQRGLSGGVGIMSRDVDGVVMATKALWTDLLFQLDCNVAPLKFNDDIYNDRNKLRIGYFDDDGFFTPVPSVRRAVNLTKDALEAAGHTLIPFQPPHASEAIPHLGWKLAHADGNYTWLAFFKGEAIDRSMAIQMRTYLKSKLFRMLARPFTSERVYNTWEGHAGVRTVEELWKTQFKASAYKSEYMSEWKRHNIDVLLCPGFYLTAVSNDNCCKTQYAASSTIVCNLLNFPGGIVPVTTVTEEDDRQLAEDFPINDEWDKMAREACKDSAGLPVGVQCIALQYQDELCMRLMKEVEIAVGNL
ncbi:fatty-acid amide hydrolase 1-like [Glandiceps talaboti]